MNLNHTQHSLQLPCFLFPYFKEKSGWLVGWLVSSGGEGGQEASFILHFHFYLITIPYALKHFFYSFILPANCSVKEKLHWLELNSQRLIQNYCNRERFNSTPLKEMWESF